MNHSQDHDHDSGHDHGHAHRDLIADERPFDQANQSLSDALRASFRILKGIMMVLVVLYLFSNVKTVGSHEQVLVLRLGRLLPTVHEAGLVPALPFPIDQVVVLPTRKSNDLTIASHTFRRMEGEEGKPLSFVHRGMGEGLHPSLDGALLTADSGLVHVQWKVTYKFESIIEYVNLLAGEKVDAAERLIQTLVETVGIEVAAELGAAEMIRTRVDYVQSEIKRRVQRRLSELRSGIEITLIEMFEPTPPVQIRDVFDETQKAENAKQRRIRDAEQERIKILNEAAGAAHRRLVPLLDEWDQARASGKSTDELSAELDRLLERDIEGRAGKMIKDAGSYYAVVVGGMQSDVELYRALLPEYRRNPELLIGRLWERTRQDVFESSGVSKIYRPLGLRQIWVIIPLDPEQTRLEEEERLKKKDFDPSKLLPDELRIVGPEFD
jgi:regulator of protease activity HflC (stomatin/prohibitin superfamily)